MGGQHLQVLYIDNYRWQEAEAVRRASLGEGAAGGEGPGVGTVPSKLVSGRPIRTWTSTSLSSALLPPRGGTLLPLPPTAAVIQRKCQWKSDELGSRRRQACRILFAGAADEMSFSPRAQFWTFLIFVSDGLAPVFFHYWRD